MTENSKSITVEFGADTARQNITYREVFFSYDNAHQQPEIPSETVASFSGVIPLPLPFIGE